MQKVGGPSVATSSWREIPFKGDKSSLVQGETNAPVERALDSSSRHWCSFSRISARVGGGAVRQATNVAATRLSAASERRIIVPAREVIVLEAEHGAAATSRQQKLR